MAAAARVRHPAKPFGVVVWNDAVHNETEVSDEDIVHAPTRLQSYGWIVRSTEEGVAIAAEWRPGDGMWRGWSFIPRPMVVEEHVLRLGAPRKSKKAAAP